MADVLPVVSILNFCFNTLRSALAAVIAMLPRDILFWHKREDSKTLQRKRKTEPADNVTPVQITPSSDPLTNAKMAKVIVQGIIERNPSRSGRSPVVVLRTLRVGGTPTEPGKPTLAIFSRSEDYNDQLKEAIEMNEELRELELDVKTGAELVALGKGVKIEELKAGKSVPERRGSKIENPNKRNQLGRD